MTTTIQRPVRGGRAKAGAGVEAADQQGTAALPAPPKARRRWGLAAAMLTVVSMGVLGNVWLLGSLSDAEDVVAATASIERGAVITREALISVQVSTDPALRTVPAAEMSALVGQRAAVDIAAGTLVTEASVTSENIPAGGYSLVGVAATAQMMPGTALAAGDRVRVVATPGPQGGVDDAETDPVVVEAVVVSVSSGTDVSGAALAERVITVEVPHAQAATLAALAATGRVGVVLDSRDR